MSHRICVLGLFVVLLAALTVKAQDETFKLKVDTTAVTLEVVVQDANNRPITNLTQADFQIFEDGEPQEIRYFAPSETPRSILLMFDVTGVMESQGPFMAKGFNVFLANLRPQDRIAVAAFGPEFEMLMNFRNAEKGKPIDIKLPRERIGTNLYDALDYAGRRFNNEKGRKAAIVMTDGRDTTMFNQTKALGNVLTLQQDKDFQGSLNSIRKRGVPLYFIALDTDPRYMGQFDYEYAYLKNPADYQRSREYANGQRIPTIAEDYLAGVRLRLERLAEVTGGRVIYPHSIEDVVGLFDQISRELGFGYTLGYAPKSSGDDGKFHRIEIRTRREGLKVLQSREGYGTKEAAQ